LIEKVNREVEHLTDREHILLRPAMYIGTTEILTKVVPIFEDGMLVRKEINFSDGFYRLFDEALDNAFDEALRCRKEKYPFKEIRVDIDSKSNKVTVYDDGRGFSNLTEKNAKTGLSHVETALTLLRSGTNFKNQDSDVSLIGTNGIGISAVNMLSDFFSVRTTNEGQTYTQVWEDFVEKEKEIRKATKVERGTTITYIPRKKSFNKIKFDQSFVYTTCLFRKFAMMNNEELKDVKFKMFWDGEEQNLNVQLLPKEAVAFKLNKHTELYVWRTDPGKSISISFVNGSLCTGFHQSYIKEKFDEKVFNSRSASEFYETAIIVNLPPKHVQFQEQNKNRFITSRDMMDRLMPFNIKGYAVGDFKKTDLYIEIVKAMDEKNYANSLKKIKQQRKKSQKIMFSEKYYPANKKHTLFLVEGSSACGSLCSNRDVDIHAVYALRGKVKNARCLSDLSENREIMDLMNILNLNIEDGGKTCSFNRIAIAADQDCLAEDTLVNTKDGYKKIKDLTYFDMILGSDNEYHKINQIIQTKKDKIIEFMINGELIKCSENHLFYIYRDNEVIQEKAKNIKKTDYFLTKK